MASAHLLTPTALRSKSPRPASGTGQAYPAYHEPNASRWQRDAARKRMLDDLVRAAEEGRAGLPVAESAGFAVSGHDWPRVV